MTNPESRSLPENPNLNHLKDQAKNLLKSFRKDETPSVELVATLHPKFKHEAEGPTRIALHDCQLVIARQYGFASWPKLKSEVEARLALQLPPEDRLVQAVWGGRLQDVQTLTASKLSLNEEVTEKLTKAVRGISDRCVWHRSFYRDIAKELIKIDIPCDIWSAARLGLLEHIEELVSKTGSQEGRLELLSQEDPWGRSPLRRASLLYGADPECDRVAKWLIGQGVSIDLWSASALCMLDELKELAKHSDLSVIINQKKQGSSPLNWAVRPRRVDGLSSTETDADTQISQILIELGADLETTDEQENGMHPLHHVGEWCGSETTADLLIDAGSDLDAKDDNGWTPLDYAVDRNRENMIAHFKKRGARQTLSSWPNTFGEKQSTAFDASKRGDLKQMQQLLRETPELIAVRGHGGETLIHWPAHEGHYELTAELIRLGVDLSLQEGRYWGGTPLHWASERHPTIVELLLDAGADVNSVNEKSGQTPLHYCARCDDVPEVADLLLARGASLSTKDFAGNTPLDYAKRNNHKEVAKILMAQSL